MTWELEKYPNLSGFSQLVQEHAQAAGINAKNYLASTMRKKAEGLLMASTYSLDHANPEGRHLRMNRREATKWILHSFNLLASHRHDVDENGNPIVGDGEYEPPADRGEGEGSRRVRSPMEVNAIIRRMLPQYPADINVNNNFFDFLFHHILLYREVSAMNNPFGLSPFKILPMKKGFGPIHIQISNTVLWEILKKYQQEHRELRVFDDLFGIPGFFGPSSGNRAEWYVRSSEIAQLRTLQRLSNANSAIRQLLPQEMALLNGRIQNRV